MSSLKETIQNIFGSGAVVVRRTSAFGGDINRAYVLELSDGSKVFMKANSPKNIDFFVSEAAGLEAMRKTGTVRVPKVLGYGTDGGESFLLLEYIESGGKNRNSMAELGRNLAEMHLAETGDFSGRGRYGFVRDNYIGASTQTNTPAETWIDFFRERRLMPQFEWASGYFSGEDRKRINKLLDGLDRFLTEPEQPSLLHGDLWGGNYMVDRNGSPWLIDPATYVGHAEADLAMTELFGGFDRAFYDAYKETAGIDPGYRDRRNLYNLYHLLNHLNLFGGGYLHSVQSVIRRYV